MTVERNLFGLYQSQRRETGPDLLLATALEFAEKGIAVLPCHNPCQDGHCSCRRGDCRSVGKHPRTPNGLTAATIDTDVIRRWWGQWPNANLAARTGADSGVFVIDVDADGFDALEAFAATHGTPNWCPDTWTVRTGNLGAHLYFHHPGVGRKVRTTAGVIAPGVDVRGDGGYAVLPPSLHTSGRRYEWLEGLAPDGIDLAAAPPWLLGSVVDVGTTVVRSSRPARDGSSPSDPIEAGRRNATLTSLAGTMRQRGFGEAAIEAALMEENQARCAPPLDDDEVSRIARSVGRYPPGQLFIPDHHGGRRNQTLHVGGIELTVKQRGSHLG